MSEKAKCSGCGVEHQYNESQDKGNNELVPMRIRKYVVDSDNHIVPLYAIAKDKQRLVGEKFIKMLCLNCSTKG